MSDSPMRMSVPNDVNAIFADDGRVFYNLDGLIEAMAPGVERRTFAANIVKDDYSLGLVAGETMALDFIRDQREILSLKNIVDD